MPFLTFCDNKGCMKHQTPLLDTETNEALCEECGRPIKNITEFAKRQMKSLGQTAKKKTKSSFAVKCQKCSSEQTPSLNGDEFCCGRCGEKLNISAAFERMLRTTLKDK